MKIIITDALWGEKHSDIEIRMKSLISANERFKVCREGINRQVGDKIDEHTKLFIKGYGNSPELISCFRELFFNSREMLDYLLITLNKATKSETIQTSRKFLPFCRSMMNDDYNVLNMPLINFLKTNITYVFHIRKVRNEIKNRVSNVKFRFVTDHIESYFRVPIASDEKEIIKFLDIENKEEAVRNNGYHCVFNLDVIFPEMVEFWKTALSYLGKNYGT